MFRKLFYSFGNEIFPVSSEFVPNEKDVMLVSYPKSGNTWVRALISTIIKPNSTFAEMDGLIPDIYRSNNRILRKAYIFPCGGRMIKSHESFKSTYKNVIYVMRNPKDVCASYYYYLKDIEKDQRIRRIKLDEFVRMFLSGNIDPFGTWLENVRSWSCAEIANIIYISYEQMKLDPLPNLRNICKLLNLCPSENELMNAISSCSFMQLKKKEQNEKSNWSVVKNADDKGRFFRDGGYNSVVNENDRVFNEIEIKWGDELRKLGY